jgi:hypothetical protein
LPQGLCHRRRMHHLSHITHSPSYATAQSSSLEAVQSLAIQGENSISTCPVYTYICMLLTAARKTRPCWQNDSTIFLSARDVLGDVVAGNWFDPHRWILPHISSLDPKATLTNTQEACFFVASKALCCWEL